MASGVIFYDCSVTLPYPYHIASPAEQYIAGAITAFAKH